MVVETPKFTLVHVAPVPLSLYCFLDGQVHFMNEQGVEVHGVSSAGELLGLFAKREKAQIHAIEMPRAITPLKDLVAVWHLYCLFRRLRPEIVHAHTIKGGLLGMIAALLARVPVRIYNMHGLLHITTAGLKQRLFYFVEKVSCSLAHHVFCVSASLADQVRKEGLCRSEKLEVLVNGSINGVDATGRFQPAQYDTKLIRDTLGIPQEARVIGFVGRLVRDKGILELITAWQGLRSKFDDLHLLLVGPFEEKDAIPEADQQKLYTDARVHLVGHENDPAPYYAAMDVLAFPSHREGFGLVAIEAAAMQIPVVATRIPGCVDSVTDGETGLLVPCGDSEALMIALASYLEDPQLRRKHGEAGRKKALQDFQPTAIWMALHAKYIDLLNAKGGKTCNHYQ
jgi:glycosyltransferase involved in cell wall biosynthesis